MKGNYKTEIIVNETTGEKILQPVSEYYQDKIYSTVITNLKEDKVVNIEKSMVTAMKLYDKWS